MSDFPRSSPFSLATGFPLQQEMIPEKKMQKETIQNIGIPGE
jgi:hypothetical protein